MIDVTAAEHEAAHLVVGLALGLKLRKATARRSILNGQIVDGHVWFQPGRHYLAFGIMVCAGIAWERRPEVAAQSWPEAIEADYKQAWQIHRFKANIETSVRVAREMLDARRRLHARVTSELLDRDLTGRDIEALVIE